MAKYFGHKPSWKERHANKVTPKVLDLERQPSGVYKFNGKEYSPPASGKDGRYRGNSVPNTGNGRPTKQWSSMQKMKQRIAGFTTKMNVAMAVADLIGDPNKAKELLDYGWDDFMRGELPPPFDWLNPDYPPEWLPTKTPEESVPMPPGSKAHQAPDGTWWGFSPALDGEWVDGTTTHMDRDGFRDDWWPPPGTSVPSGTTADLKRTGADPTNPPFSSIVEGPPPWWFETFHGPNHEWGSPWPAWVTRVNVFQRFGDGSAGRLYYELYYRPRPDGSPPPSPALAPSLIVTHGATEAEALQTGTPARNVWTPLPVPYKWRHPYQNLIKEVAGTRIVSLGETDPVGAGGTRVIAPPAGPVIVVPTKPGEPPHPPGNGTKEKKRLVGGAAFFFTQKVFHAITEYQDLVDALYDAIPKRYQCKGAKNVAAKSLCIFANLDKVDIGDAIVNVAWNQFEDFVLGTGLFGLNKRAAQARGDRYAFRTLNSANGYGGLEDLGEAYGEFSKEHINPRKEDLKRWLTERFGI